MTGKPFPRLTLTILVAFAFVSTISLVVVLAVACLIGKMGDDGGRVVLESVALAIGLLWLIDLICLVFAVAVNSLYDSDSKSDPPVDGAA